jgi:hypothetical protein
VFLIDFGFLEKMEKMELFGGMGLRRFQCSWLT